MNFFLSYQKFDDDCVDRFQKRKFQNDRKLVRNFQRNQFFQSFYINENEIFNRDDF